MRRDVFQAIVDPTRREIISLLASQSLTVNGVAERFKMSRPAVSKHIKILNECGLVVIKQRGRERYCEAQLKKLREVSEWTQKFSQFWDRKLLSLKTYVEGKK